MKIPPVKGSCLRQETLSGRRPAVRAMRQIHRVALLLLSTSQTVFLLILLLRPCPQHDRLMYPTSNYCDQDQDPTSLGSDRRISLNGTYDGPDHRYEELRMRLQRTAKRVAEVDKEGAKEISRLLVSDLRQLWQLDGRGEQRRCLAERTAKLVQQRLRHLQNPKDCRTAKKLACPILHKCGFGCLIHHATYCLILAYGMQRTLVPSQKTLFYGNTSWEEIFEPLSNTCDDADSEQMPSSAARHDPMTLVINTSLAYTRFHPPAVPADLLPAIRLFHGAPHAWWVGQVVSYLLRLRPGTAQLVQEARTRLNFSRPIVGIHVRRGDKLINEAEYHSVDEYMAEVEDFYETLEITQGAVARNIYLATDDVRVFDEINKKYPDYTVFGDRKMSWLAGRRRRDFKRALKGILVDVHLLSMCDYVVCTFSSNICRLVYELMQSLDTDASLRVTSLDWNYVFVMERNRCLYRVILNHLARSPEEMNMRHGDVIAGSFYDKRSIYGRNLNTRESGYFPIFKTVEDAKSVFFPRYTFV